MCTMVVVVRRGSRGDFGQNWSRATVRCAAQPGDPRRMSRCGVLDGAEEEMEGPRRCVEFPKAADVSGGGRRGLEFV
ncbi:pollen-specific leucine-rich repeat extensin-like protein 4 [Iris pallida]|uniref:Pollen-specific leucine-rich repeat extensin-like protein 4 n=1 Tax=Iris pallida TaxID=29817 RepID=A0AAX6EC15_IRIPA|nr:pollen-specific leucine-rich repeat extensin-like protein 4 [Iris pallida]